jgi:phage terminase large subunit-like protein
MVRGFLQWTKMSKWGVVYKKAIADDGSLLFPEKLTAEFLEAQKRKLGSYQFSNQYQNEIIPEELQTFKKHWLKYYTTLPPRVYTFAMIDPAIGQKKTSDLTGITVVSVDIDTNWYFRVARGERMTPTQIVNLCFDLQKEFQTMGIGIEAVAYQEALLYMLAEEMRRRKVMIPVKEIRPPTDRTKEARIRGLVPRYEWGRAYHCQGLYDYETQLLQFPRSSRDDILDSAASLEELVIYPEKEKVNDVRPNTAADPGYEAWYIRNKLRQNQA